MKSSGPTLLAALGIVWASGMLTSNPAQEPAGVKNSLEASGPVSTQALFTASAPVAPAATQSVSEADTIVVTATRIPQAIRDVGVSISVVPRERIEELNAQNVGEVLKNVTDARVIRYGGMGAESEISLRGSSANQVLVMVDGRKVNLASLGMPDLSLFPVDQVERIEVLRGPGSVLYGAGAMAGVVNIVTRDPPESRQTDVVASYGTKNTHILRLDNGGKITEDLGYLVTVSRNASDGWRDNSACEGYNVSGKLAYDLSRESRLTLNSGFSRQNKGVPGSIHYPTPDARQYERQYWADLTHTHEFDSDTWLTSKIFLNQNWQEYKELEGLTDTINRNQTVGLDVQQTLPLGERQLLLGGVSLENDVVDIRDAEDLSIIGGHRNLFTGAAFLQDEIKLLERLTATPGLRCDIQSKWGAELSPKLSGLYKLTDATRLKASIGRGFRAPTINELYWRDDYTVGNPDLKPEEAFSYDVGIQQQFGKKSMLQVSLFQSHMKNLITWFDDGTGIYRAQNINDAFLQGLETELTIQLTDEISCAANYTLLDAQDTSGPYKDKALTHRPKNKIGGRLGYQSAWGLKLNVNAEYTDSVFANRINTKELGGFMTLGAYAAQTVTQSVEIFVRGDNLFNKEYQLIDGYPMPGFSVMGGVKTTF